MTHANLKNQKFFLKLVNKGILKVTKSGVGVDCIGNIVRYKTYLNT